MTDAILKDGIYFGLDEKTYHALPRLSQSGCKEILASAAGYWKKYVDPARKEQEPTLAMKIGRAWHACVFEPQTFHSNFARKFDDTGYDLTNHNQIKVELDKLGEPKSKTGEGVLDAAKRLRDAGYTGSIMHLDKEQYDAELGERVAIDTGLWDTMIADAARMKDATLSPQTADKICGGYAEVSILWTCPKHHIKMKARIDYLRSDMWVDLKTFDNPQGKTMDRLLADQVRYLGYYIQVWIYHSALELVRAGKLPVIDGDKKQVAFVDAIKARDSHLPCWYIFQEKNGVPNTPVREMPIMAESYTDPTDMGDGEIEGGGGLSVLMEKARMQIDYESELVVGDQVFKSAKLKYMEHMAAHGKSPWILTGDDAEKPLDMSYFHPAWISTEAG